MLCACPLPEVSSTARPEAASAAAALGRWSSGWPGSCCLQRGSRPSGTFAAGPRSPVRGAAKSPASGPSAPASICLRKVATATWQDADPTPSVFPETESGCSVEPLPINTLPSPQGGEDGGNVRKRNESVWKKQNACTLEAACKHVYTKTHSYVIVGVI